MSVRSSLSASAIAALAACASSRLPMYVPTEEEQRACEEQGGSIELAHAINAYVCLLPQAATP